MLAIAIAEAVAIGLLALLVAGLLRSHAEILRSLHLLGAGVDDAPDDGGLPMHPARITPLGVADVAHDLAGGRLDGGAASVAVVGVRHDTVLAFLSSGCLSCQPFWEALRDGPQLPDGLRAIAVVQDEDSRSRLRELAGDVEVLVSSQAWSDYAVPGSPHVVMVHGPTGRVVGEGTATTFEQVVDLLSQARADGHEAMTDPRDNPTRIDRELAAVGIGQGHPSLHPEAGAAESGR
jgi:hypothetical protein